MSAIFASDAGRWAVVGAGFLALAILAWLGDRRRMKRARPDSVGFMPWTALFLLALLGLVVAGSLALKLWLAPV